MTEETKGDEKKEERGIYVTAIRADFLIPATSSTTEVRGTLEASYKDTKFGLHLDGRNFLRGEELDLVNTLRTNLVAEPICQRLIDAAEASKVGV